MRQVLAIMLILSAACGLVACGPSQSQYEKDEAAFQKTADDALKALQWRLDKVTAASLWCQAAGTVENSDMSDEDAQIIPNHVWAEDGNCSSPSTYKTFLKCHDEPPQKQDHQKVCSILQKRVADQEAKDEAKRAKQKAAW
ncbi:MAG TPA: hypothetical protein VKV05_03270 [Terriglobales bacterium]|nr:hypothetical protein [Terriglobales bacterium]